MGLRDGREARQVAGYLTNRYLDDPAQGLKLLANIIAMPENKPDVVKILEQLNKLIHYEFIELCGQENLPNEAEMFKYLTKAFEDLEDLAEFHALANKNVVAVGGGFSSGKSRFLNALLHDDLLPTDTTPTTSIPTYISLGEVESISALNNFNQKVPLDRDAVKAISHAFFQKYNVSFSHIIKILTMEKPAFPYQNIAFLDTPGYSKSDSMIKGDNTDEKLAKEHLRMADYLIWLIDAKNGTLPEADVEFIHALRLERPLFVVINKADLQTANEVERILKNIRSGLREAAIESCGVTAYDSMTDGGRELAGDSLQDFLRETDAKFKHTRIKQDFSRVFEVFISFNQNEKVKNAEVLGFLNLLASRVHDGISAEDNGKLKALIATVQQRVKKLQSVVGQFEKLAEKVDGTVDAVLQNIVVVEENKAERGVVGYGNVRDEKTLARLEQDAILSGKVLKITSFGVFIDCGLGDCVMLDEDDIGKKHTLSPFCIGATCSVQVIEINRSKKSVKVVVHP